MSAWNFEAPFHVLPSARLQFEPITETATPAVTHLHGAFSVKAIASVILRQVKGLIDCEQVKLILVAPDQAIAHLFVFDLQTQTAEVAISLLLDDTFQLPSAVWQGHIQVIPNDPPAQPLPLYLQVQPSARLASYMLVPLQVQQRFVGLLVLEAETAKAFTVHQVQLAKHCADLMAIALEQTQQTSRAQPPTVTVSHPLLNLSTEQQQQLQHRILQACLESQSLQQAAIDILPLLAEALSCSLGVLWQIKSSTQQRLCSTQIWSAPIHAIAELLEQTQAQTLPIGLDIPGNVWLSTTPLWQLNLEETRYSLRKTAALKAGLQGAIAFPIRQGDQCFGVIELLSPTIPALDPHTLTWMVGLTQQLGHFAAQWQTAAALRDREQQLRLLLQNMPVMVDARDENDQIIVWNRECEQVTGYAAEEVIGNPEITAKLYPGSMSFRSKSLLSKWVDYRNWELKILCKEGSTKTILYSNLSAQFPISGWASWGIGVDITERIQTEVALHRQISQERLMVGIAHHIRQSLDLHTILATTADEIRHFLKADRVLIQALAADTTSIGMMASCQPAWAAVKEQDYHFLCPEPEQLARLQQGEMVAIAHITTLSPLQQQIFERFQVKASLMVPILQEQTLWGLMIVHQCDRPREWHTDDLKLLQNLATQVAVAIQQSELYQQVQDLNETLEAKVIQRTAQLQQMLGFEATTRHMTQRVRDSLDEAEILQTAVQALTQSLGLKGCHAAIYDLERQTATIAYEAIDESLPAQIGQVASIADFPGYRQLLRGEPSQFCPLCPSTPASTANLSYPIWGDQGPLGHLGLVQQAPLGFSALIIHLVQQVANQCAIAIRQARLYEAAQAQVNELEHLNQLKDDFLSTVSHELRSPLANIRMTLQVLEITSLSTADQVAGAENLKKVEQCLQILREECDREINLVDDLLTLQRLAAERQPIKFEAIILNTWLPYLLDGFQNQLQTHQQTLQVNLAPELPPLITDYFILQRICTELMTNACKYTPAQETITITAKTMGDRIRLEFQNSGVSIPEQDLPHIFEKFYRVPNTNPWRYSGTGLGLALVQRLVEYIDGTIRVESPPELTRFIIELPVRGEDSA